MARTLLLADIGPLRESPDYRRIWIGQMLSGLGNQMTAATVPIQVYALTHSSFAVGLIGLALAVPLITFGLFGGHVADRVDRRRLVLLTTVSLSIVSVVFAAQALSDLRSLWLLYVLTTIQAALSAMDTLTRRTFPPWLLPPRQMPAAAALNQLSFQSCFVGGPLLAGLVISGTGVQGVYVIDVLSFTVSIYSVLRLPSKPARAAPERSGSGLLATMRLLRSHLALRMVLLINIITAVFGIPQSLFPMLADVRFHSGAGVVGLLLAAPAGGGLVISLLSGWVSNVRRHGLAIVVAAGVWGAAIACFGLAGHLWLAVLSLSIGGAADAVGGVFRSAIMQIDTPDSVRGAVNGIAVAVGGGSPRLGNLQAGVVETLTSPVVSTMSNGLACVAGVGLLVLIAPAFLRHGLAEGVWTPTSTTVAQRPGSDDIRRTS